MFVVVGMCGEKCLLKKEVQGDRYWKILDGSSSEYFFAVYHFVFFPPSQQL